MRIFKKKILKYAIPIAFGLCLVYQASWAENVYVSDMLRITLRTGPSTQNRIISSLRSGQALEILDSKDEWSFVRLLEDGQKNIEGWVLTRFLITRLPWETQATALKNENMHLKEKFDLIEKKYQKTTAREKLVSGNLAENTTALKRLQNKHESLKRDAAGFLKLRAANEATKAELSTLKNTVEILTIENKNLSSSNSRKWFATGALVLLTGLIIGLVMGKTAEEAQLKHLI